MYVTYVPVYNSVPSTDDPDYQETASTIDLLRYDRATAFQEVNPTATVVNVECLVFYPQASNPMVDRINGYLYLMCAGDITRVSLQPATLGQVGTMCDEPVPNSKMAQYYWPRTVPESQVGAELRSCTCVPSVQRVFTCRAACRGLRLGRGRRFP